jgi:probable HAF family extracellular repeat protein
MMRTIQYGIRALISAGILSIVATAPCWSQKLTWLGTLGGNESVAYGVSNNGIVVGMARNAQGQQRAFRWKCGTMTDLGTLGGPESIARDISANGDVIVGLSLVNATLWRAFKYQSGVMTDLGSLVPGGASAAMGVSANGNVIVGWSTAACPYTDIQCRPAGTIGLPAACKWVGSAITQVGDCWWHHYICHVDTYEDIATSYAVGVSKDGQVWVGYQWRLAAWRGASDPPLPTPLRNGVALGMDIGRAFGTNGDGSRVVGEYGPDEFDSIPYAWPGGALLGEWFLLGAAYSVTDDGKVVVGTCEVDIDSADRRAHRWKITLSGIQMENLNTTYASLLSPGSYLVVAHDISSNGRYIVGVGYNAATGRNEAFLLDTWPSCYPCSPYIVLLADRDLQRGVLSHDPDSDGGFSVVGGCAPQGTRYYYGLDVHPQTGEIWACDILANRIVRLSPTGNCLQTIPMPAGYTGVPTGLAIHPDGRYLHVTNAGQRIDAYDIQLGQWVATTTISQAVSLYGLQWVRDVYEALYVCDFSGQKLFLLQGNPAQPLTVLGLTATQYNPYDVAGYQTFSHGHYLDYLFITQSQGYYGNYSEVSQAVHSWNNPGVISTPTTFAPHPSNNNADGGGYVSFFGITLDPSFCMLWVSDYVRGDLFTVDLQSALVTMRTSIDPGYKLGLGVALQPRCIPHQGDVDDNGCIDDADLLAVLFAFGSSGDELGRVDVNCDGTVDDADLLVVLFNFGSGC